MNLTYGKGFTVRTVGNLLEVEGDEARFLVPDRRPEAIRAQIKEFTEHLLALPEKREFEVKHTLIDGVYTRTLYIPKGSVLVGQIHLKECVNIVAAGDISILTETGCGRIKAGHIAVSKPGIQKLGYAHEDTVFVNVFRTDETDIEKIEAEIATDDFAALGATHLEVLS